MYKNRLKKRQFTNNDVFKNFIIVYILCTNNNYQNKFWELKPFLIKTNHNLYV